MENERTTWWFWIPALPKPLIVAAWAVFWSLATGAPYMRDLAVPHQPWWLDIWHGVGGNAIGVFTWTVIAVQLTSEVVYMIFTFRANKRQVEEAAIRNRDQEPRRGTGRGTGRDAPGMAGVAGPNSRQATGGLAPAAKFWQRRQQ
ncbi:MAG: hypothetical protein OXI91_06135 [Chloroflexota bacterium]|nr:hypothetical protein [Chloroflexota bacterium]